MSRGLQPSANGADGAKHHHRIIFSNVISRIRSRQEGAGVKVPLSHYFVGAVVQAFRVLVAVCLKPGCCIDLQVWKPVLDAENPKGLELL
jgi:hypothetical protein